MRSIAFGVLLGLATASAAQVPVPATPPSRTLVHGDPIRVKARTLGVDGWQYGSFSAVRGDTLFYRPEGPSGFEQSIAITQLDAIGVNFTGGTRHSYAGRGALIGLGAGLVIGSVAVLTSRNSNSGTSNSVDPTGVGDATVAMAAVGCVLVGTLLGTVIGLAIRSNPYESVPPSSLTSRRAIRITPTWNVASHSVGLGVRLAF